jgi:hypothetical protein
VSGGPSESPKRAGPEPLPGDSWDSATTGLHRLIRGRRPRRRHAVVGLIVVVTALVTIAVLPVLLRGGAGDHEPGPTAGGPQRTVATQTPAETTGIAVVLTAPAANSRSAPSGATTTVGTTTPAVAPAPLEIEAEAGSVRLRRAVVVEVAGASGGRAVRFSAATGDLQFRSLSVPTGRYRVTLWYAPGGAWSGDVRGTDGPVPVAFVAGSGCCATLAVEVALAADGSLRIGPSIGDGAFPAIDRIRIEPT